MSRREIIEERYRNYLNKQKKNKTSYDSPKEYSLNLKIKKFNNWCIENRIKHRYTDIGEYQNRNNYLEFIEKMAVWYELRYPWFKVSELYGQETNTDIFEKSINEDFYSFGMFKVCLDPTEQTYLMSPQYKELVYIYEGSSTFSHFHLSPDGFVIDVEYINEIIKNKFDKKILIGKHIKDVLNIFKRYNIDLPKNNGIEKAINDYEKECYFRDELLNCVMYRLIDRGGNRIGPRRALLFAKEFDRDIDIPMKYGIDTSDPYLHKLIEKYLNLGGNADLECYDNYFSLRSDNEKLEKEPLEDIIETELMQLLLNGQDEEYLVLEELSHPGHQLIKK